jgi:hypothetical protein
MLANHPAMEPDSSIPKFQFRQWDGKVIREVELLKIRDNIDIEELIFPIGYSEHAIESFKYFEKLQSNGKIPLDVKFQVSLPTPFATGYNYISPHGRKEFLKVYEKSFALDIKKIIDSIPNDRLAIQWDVCQEILIFNNYFPNRSANYKDEIFSQLARIGNIIPIEVELGYHMCYGSPGDDHIIKPKNFAMSVEFANGIFNYIDRSVEFIHLPGTYGQPDNEFYEPLKDLKIPETCEIYLGLLFFDDLEGDDKRIAAARKILPKFGISTVCGWGRGNPERVSSLLNSHKVNFE